MIPKKENIKNNQELREFYEVELAQAWIDHENNMISIAATATNSGPSFSEDTEHSLRSYYCSVDNLDVLGVHRGNAIDVYVHDPKSILTGSTTVTIPGPDLYTKNIPDPEILIRTGNTNRLSNFLLWQINYTEIFFIKKLWPDFNKNDFNKILNKFNKIKRNFGAI